MNILPKILSSRVRAEIFRILFGQRGIELHNREIERRSSLSESSVRRELRKLELLDLVESRKDSNRVYYRANEEHPLYREIHNLVLKTSGLVDVLTESLDDDRINIAFVFGSIADGSEKAGSDVDLMVIGSLGLRALCGMLSGVPGRVGREINPHVFTKEEFGTRVVSRDHFIESVLRSKKLFLRGGEDDLKAMSK